MASGMARKVGRLAMVAAALAVSFACASAPPRKPVTELFAPVANPSFDFTPAQTQQAPAGYTVGVITMAFAADAVPPGSFGIVSDLERQYVQGFVSGFTAGVEKILMSKGIAVSGPFESYSEMTYPERSRCDFLVQPSVKITFQPTFEPILRLEDYGGVNGEPWTLGSRGVTLKAVAELQYVILDPLTQEKLERHKLKTDALAVTYRELLCTYSTRDEKGKVLKQQWRDLWQDQDAFPGYHNGEAATGELLALLYAEFMPKIDALVAVEEFEHLKKYKDEIKLKKVY